MASSQLRPAPPPPPRPPAPPPPRLQAPRPPAPGPPWRQWNTLQTLWASLYLIWALDALLLMTAIIGAQVHRDAMKGVGKDTAPSIIHAQHIKTALADMDANAANELLGEPGTMQAAVKTYERRRIEAATALIEAAKNITFDEREQKPIEDIQVAMGTFEARIQQARDLHQRGDATYVDAYRGAARVMDEQLLPKADELDKVNHDELENTYSTLSNRSVGSVFLLMVAGAAMLWALVAIQKFLNQRTHRILNPLLLASTLLTIAFVFYTFSTFGSERHRLRVAKEDAFTSIHALLRAQAVAYSANADEGRYLLDTAHAKDHEAAFFTKADLLAKLPAGMTYADAVAAARKGRVEGLKGYLADELNNITFDGEQEAAASTLQSFGTYLNIDGDIRRLQQGGKRAEAVALCTGTKAFDQFDKALGDTVDINQKEFNLAVEQGFSALSYFELKASIIALAIALLAFFGLLQRIQEYR